VWTGGGHGTNGSQSSDGVWNVGFRYGLILTNPHGPGFLRGRLEYAIDAVPVFLVVQKTNTAYGAGINPFAFKWMLANRGSIVPYLELGGGTLFTIPKSPKALPASISPPAAPSASTSCGANTTSALKCASCTFPTPGWLLRIPASIPFSFESALAASAKKNSRLAAAFV